MATWQVTGPSSGHHYLIYTVNQTSQDVTNNKSTLSWTIQLKADSGWSFSQWGSTVDAKINGVTVYNNYAQRSISGGTTVTIASGTTTVPHNADGTKTVSCECSWTQNSFSSYTPGNMSITGKTVTLTTIPRGSALGNIANFTLGNTITIPITKHSGSFTDNLVISVGGTTIRTISNIVNGYSLSFTTAELNTIYGKLPTSTSGVVNFMLTTKSGSTTVGTSTKTVTATIPGSIKPTIGGITISEANSAVSALGAGYIKGYSRLNIAVTGAAQGTGANTLTASNYKITANNNIINAASGTTSALASVGTLTITATVTDSRGRSATMTKDILVVDYKSPTLTTARVSRGSPSTTMSIVLAGSITSLSSKNTATYTVKSKLQTASSWTTKVNAVAISGTAININRTVTDYAVTSSYDVQIIVTDRLSSTTLTFVLPTDKVILDENKDGVGVGKYREKGALDVAGDAYISGNIYGKNKLKVVTQTFEDSSAADLQELVRKKIALIPDEEGVYLINGGWSGKTFLFSIGCCIGTLWKQVAICHPSQGWYIGQLYNGVYTYPEANDSGWIDLTLLNGFTGNVKLRKVGKIVNIIAVGSFPTSLAANGKANIATVPAGYRPILHATAMGAANGNEEFTALVLANGSIEISYLRSPNSVIAANKNWLAFNVTYMTAD